MRLPVAAAAVAGIVRAVIRNVIGFRDGKGLSYEFQTAGPVPLALSRFGKVIPGDKAG